MKNQIASFIYWLFAFVYGLLSNPRRIRLAVTIVVVCLVLAVLLVPSLTTLADALSGSGGH